MKSRTNGMFELDGNSTESLHPHYQNTQLAQQ